jgi:hypothetical protein
MTKRTKLKGSTARALYYIFVALAASSYPTSPVAAAGAWADGQIGWQTWGGYSINAESYEDAAARALASCNRIGGGCRVIAYFNRQCLAVAVQVGAAGRSSAVGPSLVDAQATVMNRCLAYGRPCQLKVGVCDTAGLPSRNPPVGLPAPQSSPPVPTPYSTPTPSGTEPRGCALYPELC